MKQIQLSNNKITLVDDEDFEWLNLHKWKCSASGYAVRHTSTEHNLRMHRAILERYGVTFTDQFVDHTNQDKLDNRKSNLRIATTSQNGLNRGKPINNSSGFKGVSWGNYHKKWEAYITIEGKKKFLGRWSTKELAAVAYRTTGFLYSPVFFSY